MNTEDKWAETAERTLGLIDSHIVLLDELEALRRRVKAVEDLHYEVIVYSLDEERIVLARLCAECSDNDVIGAIEDGEWMENWYGGEVNWPCNTILKIDEEG